MKEVLNSVIKTISERFSNVFYGTFILTWCICNWKSLLVILLSKESIEFNINHIENNFSSISNIVVYPLLMAISICVLIPWINYGLDYFSQSPKLKRIDLDDKITTEQLALKALQQSKISQLIEQNDYLKQVENLQSLVVNKDNEIDSLKESYESQIISLQKNLSLLKNSNAEIKKEYDSRLESLIFDSKNNFGANDLLLALNKLESIKLGFNSNNDKQLTEVLENALNELTNELRQVVTGQGNKFSINMIQLILDNSKKQISKINHPRSKELNMLISDFQVDLPPF